ncbi:hypothetical protein WDU94_007974 [Cyamophila willieti]
MFSTVIRSKEQHPDKMKSFIAFAAVLACVYAQTIVTPDGFLADTPEVAAAKAAHFAELSRAAYAAGATPDYTTNYYSRSFEPAAINVLSNGYLADTPEVAAAKATFFAQQARADSSFTPSAVIPSNSNNRYASSFAPASITVLPNGYLADTPEVAAAKSAHLAEVARASVPDPYYNEYYTWNGVSWVPNQ